jgi:hypothetical protein
VVLELGALRKLLQRIWTSEKGEERSQLEVECWEVEKVFLPEVHGVVLPNLDLSLPFWCGADHKTFMVHVHKRAMILSKLI